MLDHLFLEHPRSVGETYGEHMAVAGSLGLAMIAGGFACLIHAVFPCAFTSTGSGVVRRLYSRMVTNRTATGPAATIAAAE